jgi:hypothetical protein
MLICAAQSGSVDMLSWLIINVARVTHLMKCQQQLQQLDTNTS